MGFCACRAVDDMGHFVDVLAACITQETTQHRCDADITSIRREAAASHVQCFIADGTYAFHGQTGAAARLKLGQADKSTRSGDAQAFFYEWEPCCFSHEAR